MLEKIIDKIEVFTQSSICIDGVKGDDMVVYFDPFQMNAEPHDADIIMITHDHGDHFSPEDIEKVRKAGTVFVIPKQLEKQAAEAGICGENLITIVPGEKLEVCGIPVETVAAYNTDKDFHTKAQGWVGYIITVDGARCYISGDTDITPENKAVNCDIALVPIGGTYTVTPSEAAELINIIAPQVAIPTHYGTIVGKKEDADEFKKGVNATTKVIVKIK